MDTLMAAGEPDEPQRPKTDDEKVAQYRNDYRQSLKSVADVVSAKVGHDTAVATKQAKLAVVPALVNEVIRKAS